MKNKTLFGLVFATVAFLGITPASADTLVTPTGSDQTSFSMTFVVFPEQLTAKSIFLVKEKANSKWTRVEARKVKTGTPCDTCWELGLPEAVSIVKVVDSVTKKSFLFVLARIEPAAPISAIPYEEAFGDTKNKDKDFSSDGISK